MVVSQEARATEIGVDVLKRGGNAVDAAVAVGFALAVTLPRAGNLGGGGFMVIHLAGQNRPVAIDYRETAPEATTQDVFLDENGNADPQKSRNSGLAVGVPGTIAGLALAHARYGSGKFSLAELIAPAIALAQNGVTVTEDMFDTLQLSGARLQRWPSSSEFFKPDGTPLGLGDTLVQPDLARSLTAIAEGGPQAFYQGPIAEKIAASVRSAGGRMTVADLNAYEAVEREAVRGSYRGFDIVSMPPPSSGGVHLIEMLNVLEGFPLASLGARSPQALHLMIEAMKLAYADRAEFLGDSDTVPVPVARLISKSYAASLRERIDPTRARPSREIRAGSPALEAGHNTTHFSVVDGSGNAVANTTTLNFNYGLGLVAAGTGILLNNELDDFAAKPGAPNAFGLVGGSANAPGPGKRPLSSMTPTIVLKNDQPVLVTGSPGGSRIITTVLQVVLNVLEFSEDAADAVAAPRLHHQWLPDYVVAEPGFPPATIQALEALGHTVRIGPLSGSAHSVAVTPKGLVGAADERARGALAAGY
ncbi:MAG: gamma-glutamyltransferase [Xanthobacteraceae bacterium]|nr:gamma-glutamyltransferase [Xanthobacteraceae bacterium]MBV9235258.1 gamma-glutamyltransferase [Xanthobacteraceae bacterium]MBV9631106.1 gamma-glutamyltransferase [Xanthobacteraceae bacterium]